MENSVERLLPVLATWGAWLSLGLVLVGVLGILRLGWGRPLLVPASWTARLGSLAFLVVIGLGAVCLYAVTGPMAPMLGQVRDVEAVVNRPAAAMSYRTVADDASHSLSELRGQVVVLNVWATWCGPCRKELPEVDRLQKLYAARGVRVVTLSTEDRHELMAFATSHPLGTLNVYAPRFAWIDVQGRPLSFIIDRGGVVRECFIGARTYGEFERAVTRCLASDERV